MPLRQFSLQSQTMTSSSSANTLVQADTRQIFSVTQLNRRARQLLETHLSLLWVEGELSNLARPSSGHWYLTLKDDTAQIRCAMFRNRNRAVKFDPENGDKVLLRGRVSLYENRGDYQLIVEHMEPAGLGDLQHRFELLKTKLAEEGLFSNELKQVLPQFPRHIGLITSPTGAALRDILHVLARRFPTIPVNVYPTPVQGKEAARGISDALALANNHAECDVLILARGGGSIEDLWAFNEESVARAIAASTIPIVSGVGHETDTTIADFVADLRAPTPSAAAELTSPDGHELRQVFQSYSDWFGQQARARLNTAQQVLRNLRLRLRHPSEILEKQGQHLDHLEIRLLKSIQLHLHSKQLELGQTLSRYHAQAPQAKLAQLSDRNKYLHERLNTAIKHHLGRKGDEFTAAAGLLQAVSPLNTLERGYAIAQTKARHVITHVADTKVQDQIRVTVLDGTLDCQVQGIQPYPGIERESNED